jgi:hypothetical protein
MGDIRAANAASSIRFPGGGKDQEKSNENLYGNCTIFAGVLKRSSSR